MSERATYGHDMDTTASLRTVVDDVADLLDRIDPASDAQPTPCDAWDVAALRQHVVGWLTAFADGVSDDEGRCSDADAVVVEGTGAAQARDAAARLGAASPERPVSIGDSAMPGEMALAMMLWEYQVHGWDLAAATDQSWRPDEQGLEASLAFAPGMLTPDFQGEGKSFGDRIEVSERATPMERLVALSGRDPRWSPATSDGR